MYAYSQSCRSMGQGMGRMKGSYIEIGKCMHTVKVVGVWDREWDG